MIVRNESIKVVRAALREAGFEFQGAGLGWFRPSDKEHRTIMPWLRENTLVTIGWLVDLPSKS